MVTFFRKTDAIRRQTRTHRSEFGVVGVRFLDKLLNLWELTGRIKLVCVYLVCVREIGQGDFFSSLLFNVHSPNDCTNCSVRLGDNPALPKHRTFCLRAIERHLLARKVQLIVFQPKNPWGYLEFLFWPCYSYNLCFVHRTHVVTIFYQLLLQAIIAVIVFTTSICVTVTHRNRRFFTNSTRNLV